MVAKCDKVDLKARSSCGRAESVMDSHTTGPGLKTRRVRYSFYRGSDRLQPQHHIRVERSLRVWKVWEGFLDRVGPKTLKWVVQV